MRFQIPALILLIVCTIAFSAPKDSLAAADVSAVVSRMDALIKQMEALKLEFATLASSIAPSGSVLGAQSTPVFTLSLDQGETNNDIRKIQKLLATDKEIYPYGVASGFFGPKTEEAIKNFQTRFNLDPVGVVGPATRALLELFMNAYPSGNYPADVLKQKPQTPRTPTPTPAPVTPSVITSAEPIASITAKYDGDEARVKISYEDDTSNSFLISGDSKIEIVDAVASKLGRTRAYVLGLIIFSDSDDDDDEEDDEEDEDEDFDIDIEIDDDEVTLTFEFDGDDYEVEVDSTDEDDVLEEVADELDEDEVDDIDNDLADAIQDALEEALDDEDEDDEDEDDNDTDSDEIESITASVANGEAEIEVEYENGDDEEFTVEEDLEAEIIEEVADELNIDENDVEDVIEFEYEDVNEINVEIEDGKAIAFVEFEDGTEKRVKISSDDEDEIIEALAEELDEDEDDVEEWTKFDYLD